MAGGGEPRTRGLQLAVAALGVLLAAALGGAWVQGELAEWKVVQRRYNAQAAAAGRAPVALGIRQIWKPQLGVVDRCPSCHLAMGGAEPLPGEALFAAHPPLPHDPRELGCTLCHGGDGRGTSAAAAHGEREAADEPLLAPAARQSGCGVCHSGLKTPDAALAARGERLFGEYGCAACHQGPRALADVGLRGLPADWHDRHLGRPAEGPTAFAPLAEEDLPAVAEHLLAQVGAPRLMAGKRLVAERGCRGCHRLGGAGGDEGPELSAATLKRPTELPPGPGRGAAQLAWYQAHLLDPPRLVKDSRMPRLGLSDAEAELVAGYLVSLRPRALPEELVPRDRVRANRLGEREFATSGASLYAAFCSACHGARGQGRTEEDALGPVPALNGPDFLALAEDSFLVRTISEGRPGRRMPAWANPETGLKPQEIRAVVAHLRAAELPAPPFEAVLAAPADPERGREAFLSLCAPCHGPAGAGTAIGPPLAAADNAVTVDDSRIYGTLANGVAGTAMGAFRALEAGTLRALIAAVRALPRLEARRKEWKPAAGDPGRGAAVFTAHCAKCHGLRGEGLKGPALANPGFLAAASPGYLTGTIVRGRPQAKMPGFGAAGPDNARLSPEQVADVVAFLRGGLVGGL